MELKEFGEILKEIEKDYNDFLDSFLITESIKITNEAKRRTPVDTGALRSSWEIDEKPLKDKNKSIIIKNNQEYASFVEYGTRNNQPRNMITVPMNKFNESVKNNFENKFKKYVKSKGLN